MMGLSTVPTRVFLYFLLTLLVVDSVIELALIVTTVRYNHRDYPMNVQGPGGSTVILKGKPLGLWVNQGHASNGAAGTNLILVGIIGFPLLTLQRRLQRWFPKLYFPLLTTWVVLCVLALLLTIGSLGYTFQVTNSTSGQTIDLSGLTSPIRYPRDNWVPQTWFGAILKQLEFVPVDTDSVVIDGSTIPWALRSDILRMKRVTDGWQYNLIPMFLLQLGVTPLIVLEYFNIKKDWHLPVAQQPPKVEI